MPSPNRTCHICGKRYYYCTSYNCEQSRNKPSWMVMFDEENCKNIWDITSDWCSGKLSTEEAYLKLNKCDLSEIDTFVPLPKEKIVELLEKGKEIERAKSKGKAKKNNALPEIKKNSESN